MTLHGHMFNLLAPEVLCAECAEVLTMVYALEPYTVVINKALTVPPKTFAFSVGTGMNVRHLRRTPLRQRQLLRLVHMPNCGLLTFSGNTRLPARTS